MIGANSAKAPPALLILAVAMAVGCYDARRSNPLDSGAFTAVSVSVDQTVGRATTTISWTPYDGAAPFSEYRILRQTGRTSPAGGLISDEGEFLSVSTVVPRVDTLAVITDPDRTAFVDDSLVANFAYVYRVSVVNTTGLEFPSVESEPVVGPFMQQLSFYSDRTGDWEVFLINVDGSGLQNLTNHPGHDGPDGTTEVGRAAWSPDGSRIAFSTSRDGNLEIYVMEADGSNQVNLTNNAALDFEPAWSPDGDRIAFVSDRGGSKEIWVMNADGTDPVRLTTGEGDEFAPDWSPDGTRIAFWLFLSDPDTREIYVMNADGTGVSFLANAGFINFDPVWSPDGGRIAFLGFGEAGGGVWMVDADGSNLELVAEDGFWPHWSPDGSQLTYTCNEVSDICISNADGTGEVNITNHPATDK